MTWLSVSSDVALLDNFLPHLHSTEQRRESVTVDHGLCFSNHHCLLVQMALRKTCSIVLISKEILMEGPIVYLIRRCLTRREC